MPTYEYQCLNCGRHTEAVQRFSDDPLRECPHCGGPLRRVFHPVGIVLKGSGFYSTDNRGASKRRSGEPKKESGGEAGGEGGGESKPAEKKKESKPDSTSSDSSKASKKSDGPAKK